MTGPSTVASSTLLTEPAVAVTAPADPPSASTPPPDPGTAIADCVTAVAAVFATVFATMDGWGADLAARNWPAAGPSPAQLDLATRSLVVEELSRPDATVVGAGFIARPDWVRDAPRYLSWWLGPTNPVGRPPGRSTTAVRRLSVDLDPHSDAFRDYTALEWWRVPVATGRPHITGPYVDYLCTDEYTLTLTAPVLTGDGSDAMAGMVGLVGVDIYVRTIESLLLPQLQRAGRPLTVVNSAGRIVVSTDPHRAAGTVLRFAGLRERLATDPSGPLPDGRSLHACPGTGLTLLLDAG